MFIVITRTYFDADTKETVMDLSRRSKPVFEQQKGFKSIRMHLSHDGSHMSTYFEWETKDDHEACLTSPDWGELNNEWGVLMGSEKVKFELNTYDILEF